MMQGRELVDVGALRLGAVELGDVLCLSVFEPVSSVASAKRIGAMNVIEN